MAVFITYSIWTFLSMLLLKGGIEQIVNNSIGYLPVFLITLFIQVIVIAPITLFISVLARNK